MQIASHACRRRRLPRRTARNDWIGRTSIRASSSAAAVPLDASWPYSCLKVTAPPSRAVLTAQKPVCTKALMQGSNFFMSYLCSSLVFMQV